MSRQCRTVTKAKDDDAAAKCLTAAYLISDFAFLYYFL